MGANPQKSMGIEMAKRLATSAYRKRFATCKPGVGNRYKSMSAIRFPSEFMIAEVARVFSGDKTVLN